MSSSKITEGEADFSYPAAGKPLKTWYRVYGDLTSGGHPLIALHGGPGVGHNYLQSLGDLSSKHSVPVILYDQCGCGRSTHLPEKKGDAGFWTASLFLAELQNLLQHLGIQDAYDLFGNSWGGMLGAEHAVRRPKGLRRLVLADAPADMRMWVEAANGLRAKLPQDVQDVLKRHEEDGTTDSPEYEEAVLEFYKRHVCRIDPMPQEVVESFENIKKDNTVYHTMNGPSEFYVIGSLKGWSVMDQLHKIEVPTMLINGFYDEATDWVVEPFFQNIPKVRWFTFAESSHMPHYEERDKFMEVVSRFLQR